MKKNVLLLETVAGDAERMLRENTRVIEAFDGTNPVQVARGDEIHAVVTRGKGQVTRDLLDACPNLEVIARCGVGLDNVDLREAEKRNVRVIHAPGSNADTIAEHTLMLMLMLVRNGFHSVRHVKIGDWAWRNGYNGDEIRGKKLGILGLGNIGRRVAKLADAFGMEVRYWDKFPVEAPYESLSMDALLADSDVITIHVPLVDETERMIGREQLGMIRSDAYLINTARGGIIDQKALAEALEGGEIAGFAADVLAEEPPSLDEPLLEFPNVLITPHTGSLTDTTYRYMCTFTVKNVIATLNGEEPDPRSVYGTGI